MPDVFLSYGREDATRAARVADALSTRGWTVWWDREIAHGQAFDLAIESALAEARCVVVLWSPAAVASRWVRAEAEDGASRGILVQAMIEDTTLPLGVRALQAIDLRTWQGEATHEGLIRLVAAVEEATGGASPIPVRDPADELRTLRMRLLTATPSELQRLQFEADAFLDRYPGHVEARVLLGQIERAIAPAPRGEVVVQSEAPEITAAPRPSARWAGWLAIVLALLLLLIVWWLL